MGCMYCIDVTTLLVSDPVIYFLARSRTIYKIARQKEDITIKGKHIAHEVMSLQWKIPVKFQMEESAGLALLFAPPIRMN